MMQNVFPDYQPPPPATTSDTLIQCWCQKHSIWWFMFKIWKDGIFVWEGECPLCQSERVQYTDCDIISIKYTLTLLSQWSW